MVHFQKKIFGSLKHGYLFVCFSYIHFSYLREFNKIGASVDEIEELYFWSKYRDFLSHIKYMSKNVFLISLISPCNLR